MSIPLADILARLRNERLPTFAPALAHAPTTTLPLAHPHSFAAVTHLDPDAADPRWHSLFLQFFIHSESQVHDDLLFFVRASPSAPAASLRDQDPVFVRRRIPNVLPALSDIVDWKQSFFLNLICQLPCTLTVAVCSRVSPDAAAAAVDASILTSAPTAPSSVGATPSAIENRPAADSAQIHAVTSPDAPSSVQPSAPTHPSSSRTLQTSLDDPLGATATSSPMTASEKHAPSTNDRRPSVRSRMIAKRRITKKVFAAPFKSRMDVKDALMNECSFPLVYYTVNDFESHILQLPIHEREYLCVELSLTIPADQSPEAYSAATDAISAISIEQDNTPFPLPPKHSKTILFQGAVPYTSLLDIYQQKGLAAQNQLKSPWSKIHSIQQQASGAPGRSDSTRTSAMPVRTEYIMMRGPHGKGQCQVAIAEGDDSDDITQQTPVVPSESAPEPTQSFTDRIKMLGSVVKNQFLGSNPNANPAINGGGSGIGEDRFLSNSAKKPQCLRGSMTYVNVPWQSIIADILDNSNHVLNQITATDSKD